MISSASRSLLILACSFLVVIQAFGKDYVRLHTGRLVEGAVLRQDSTAVFVTDWDSRHLLQPPLQVFTRDEVESIWLGQPPQIITRIPYIPHSRGLEFGGSIGFQTWSESPIEAGEYVRSDFNINPVPAAAGTTEYTYQLKGQDLQRSLLQITFEGGYTILPQISFDFTGDISIPVGGSSDAQWRSFDPGFQASMSLVGHPVVWRGIVPYALFGGGASLGMPINGFVTNASNEIRNLLNFGAGIKWGANGMGYRIELRHFMYSWSPDEYEESGVRVPKRETSATTVRFGMFFYR